jgi:hypothetical protein
MGAGLVRILDPFYAITRLVADFPRLFLLDETFRNR